MKQLAVLASLILILLLAGCGGGAAGDASGLSGGQSEATVTGRLSASGDGLTVQTQLAVGTLQLESTDLAVDETEAAELLPLWQALLSLSSSDTTAEVELTAVLNQIQDTMDPAQIQAIAAMNLTQDAIQTMIADGTISFGRGFGGNRSGDTASGSGGFSGFPGGGPGGGIPGSGSGGGPGGGLGGGLGGDPSAMETRQAEFAAQSGSADFQTVAMSNAVIRLLEEKTGQAPAGNFGLFGSAVTAVSQATGLSEDDVRAGLSEGQTLAQILAANGGDVDAVAAQLAESLADSPQLQGQDAQEAVTNLLQGGQPSTDQSPQE